MSHHHLIVGDLLQALGLGDRSIVDLHLDIDGLRATAHYTELIRDEQLRQFVDTVSKHGLVIKEAK